MRCGNGDRKPFCLAKVGESVIMVIRLAGKIEVIG